MFLIKRVGIACVFALGLLALACGRTTSDDNDNAGSGGSGVGGGGEPGSGSNPGGSNSGGGARSSGGRDSIKGGGGSAVDGGAPNEAGAPTTADCSPGRTPLRRLTPSEYNNTVRAILSDTAAPGNAFPPSQASSGFWNDADAYWTSVLQVGAWLEASETLAANYRAAGNLTLACAADAENCASDFITELGKKLFRRPVTDDEVSSYLAIFSAGASNGGTFEEGLEWVLGRMLQSPHFLYRVELESSGVPAGTVVPLSDYSVATRLSYFLWSSTPDAALLAAADEHRLSTEDGLTAEVRRMVAAPEFEATLSSFHAQWTRWSFVLSSEKAAATLPPWTASLRAAMVRESELFVTSVFDAGGSFEDLLTATHTFVNPDLAQFYGVAYPGKGTEFVQADVPHRAGLLTQPSILAGVGAHSSQTSPVQRGYLIRNRFLCFDPPSAPQGILVTVPTPIPGGTTRERLEAHSREPACAGCHVYLDPLGFTLESFDEFGRYRDTEGGLPIDASGGLTRVPSRGDVSDPSLAPVDGALDLGQQLSELPEARQCLVKNWFRFAAGHVEESADACALSALLDRFDASGQKLDDLVFGIATSDIFRRRTGVAP